MNNFIHEYADVKSPNIGEKTQVWQFTIILDKAVIGKNCNINSHCFIENDVVIMDNVTVKSGVYLWDGIVLEDNVFIGPNVSFTNDKYPRSKKEFSIQKTYIKEGASIGAGSVLLCGISIGEFAMIGAGSIVTHDIQPYTLWYGNPAMHKGYITTEGEILDLDMISKVGIKYHYINNKLVII